MSDDATNIIIDKFHNAQNPPNHINSVRDMIDKLANNPEYDKVVEAKRSYYGEVKTDGVPLNIRPNEIFNVIVSEMKKWSEDMYLEYGISSMYPERCTRAIIKMINDKLDNKTSKGEPNGR